MDHDFWHARWEQNQIGFHLEQINPHLERFWDELGLAAGEGVFVPLCGKSRDLRWLAARGHPVLGIEISPLAVEAFFVEQGLAAEPFRLGRHAGLRHGEIRVLCGDFFALSAADLQGIVGVYDRASLIALPPPMRGRYVEHLAAILPAAARTLLVTLEYPEAEMDGPPFSVREREVHALYGARYRIALRLEADVLTQHPAFRAKGLTSLLEKAYLLTPP
jgi:thiopurine S-methyltransferase